MTERSKDEVQREVDARRAAFAASLDAVAVRVEAGADRVQGALVKVKDVTTQGRAVVSRHPLVFVAAAVGVGLALGVISGRRRARRAVVASQVPMVVEPPRRSSLLWAAAGFLGKLALRQIVNSVAQAREPRDVDYPRGRS